MDREWWLRIYTRWIEIDRRIEGIDEGSNWKGRGRGGMKEKEKEEEERIKENWNKRVNEWIKRNGIDG